MIFVNICHSTVLRTYLPTKENVLSLLRSRNSDLEILRIDTNNTKRVKKYKISLANIIRQNPQLVKEYPKYLTRAATNIDLT